jgi:hypothetical protein
MLPFPGPATSRGCRRHHQEIVGIAVGEIGMITIQPERSGDRRGEFEVPEPFWLVKKLHPQALAEGTGLARYRSEFHEL